MPDLLIQDMKLPSDFNTTVYIPVYTYDGVTYKGLDCTFNLQAAKDKLKSVLPDAWRLSHPELKDHFKSLRCGLCMIDLKTGMSAITWIEFVPGDLLH